MIVRLGYVAMSVLIENASPSDHFTVLSTPRPEVLENSINDLIRHDQMLTAMGLDRLSKCNIHIGVPMEIRNPVRNAALREVISSPRSRAYPRAHADYVDPAILLDFMREIASSTPQLDVMLESKMKDAALIQLMENLSGEAGIRIIDGASFELEGLFNSSQPGEV